MKRLIPILCLLATTAMADTRADIQTILKYTAVEMDSLDIWYAAHAGPGNDVIADIVGGIQARASSLKAQYEAKYGPDLSGQITIVALEASVKAEQDKLAAEQIARTVAIASKDSLIAVEKAARAVVQAQLDSILTAQKVIR